ncbi:MAG TPA: hypothetical protein VMA09_08570 [Candidatus Binataceae bacterium]|nr:hypothetical protein [Candidatus Binataceae bacterium]
MYAYQIAGWTVFFSVAAGVAATLTGLIFVAVSINLSRILEFPGLSERAAESILQLVAALMIPLVGLVPDQSLTMLGIQITIGGFVLWILQVRFQRRALHITEGRRRPFFSFAIAQVATILFIVGGISTIARAFGGLYWLVPGIIFSIAVGVSNAWVLLVEILR